MQNPPRGVRLVVESICIMKVYNMHKNYYLNTEL